MSTPHYEYPSSTRMSWPPFTTASSPSNKVLESCQMSLSTANKLTESFNSVSAALPTTSVPEQWRHFTPEHQFFSQVILASHIHHYQFFVDIYIDDIYIYILMIMIDIYIDDNDRIVLVKFYIKFN